MKKRACLLFILILTCSFATNLYAEALSSGSTYTIRSAMKHNYAIDIYWGAQKSLRGRKVQLYNYLCRDNQQFVVSSVGIGYYLDVDRGECRDEANIQNSRKTDRNNQRWLLTSVGNTTKQIGNSTKQKILRKKNETAKNNTKASFVFVEMGLEALNREIGRAVQGDEQSKLRVINLWKQQLSKIDMKKYNSKEARSRIQNLIDHKKIPAYILERGVYKYTEGHNAAYVNEENVSMRSQPDTEAKVVAKLNTTTTTYLMYLGEWEYNLDNWICVKLASGELGWVKRRYIELIPNADFQIIAHQLREEKQPANSRSNKYSIILISRENILDETINKYYLLLFVVWLIFFIITYHVKSYSPYDALVFIFWSVIVCVALIVLWYFTYYILWRGIILPLLEAVATIIGAILFLMSSGNGCGQTDCPFYPKHNCVQCNNCRY